MKILILDDSATARLFVKKVAQMLLVDTPDVEFFQGDSGEKALQILNENSDIDVILSDVNMPEMSGFTFMHNIQLNDKLKTIPVIFITSLSNASNTRALIGMGAKAVIPKPLKLDKLKAVLESIGIVEMAEESWG